MITVGSIGTYWGYAGNCGTAQFERYRMGFEGDKPPQFPYLESGAGSVGKLIDPPPQGQEVPIRDGHLDVVV